MSGVRTVTDDEATTRAYHQRSKHALSAFAAGPDTLDWDAQPDPFRRFDGAPATRLPLAADDLATDWSALATPEKVAPQAIALGGVAVLLELSLALTAWKQSGPDRWALRANPSSGNLHPTEAYVLATGVQGLADGLHHYQPREHALALRRPGRLAGAGPALWIGLSSIHWREAWKYGERAFRYCQLDVGHALGGIRYAAAALGWQACVVDGIGHGALAALLGLDRDGDFGSAEREEAELLIRIGVGAEGAGAVPAWIDALPWSGVANRLDRHPMYRWPVIDAVARATRSPEGFARAHDARSPALDTVPTPSPRGDERAATIIRGRRSAQRFDRARHMPLAVAMRVLAALQPHAGVPWDAWPSAPRVHAVLWAHRIDGLAPGAYLMPRGDEVSGLLAALAPALAARGTAGGSPADLALHPLGEPAAMGPTLRRLNCNQAIAGDACFVVSLLAELDLRAPWAYRDLLRESGLMGQVLYLQAEAQGYSGTGIGCYFDDELHGLLGLHGPAVQLLYQFTVGAALVDARIQTEPPYADRPVVPAHAPGMSS